MRSTLIFHLLFAVALLFIAATVPTAHALGGARVRSAAPSSIDLTHTYGIVVFKTGTIGGAPASAEGDQEAAAAGAAPSTPRSGYDSMPIVADMGQPGAADGGR